MGGEHTEAGSREGKCKSPERVGTMRRKNSLEPWKTIRWLWEPGDSPGKRAGGGERSCRRRLGEKYQREEAVRRQKVKNVPSRENVKKNGFSRVRHRLAGVPGTCSVLFVRSQMLLCLYTNGRTACFCNPYTGGVDKPAKDV